ncbi:putative short-chain dehydrogenase/reductase family protein, partial [Setomelanomma holmii]
DLTGKTCLITGSNSGIGFACAKILSALNISHLILAVRTTAKGKAAAGLLRAQYPSVKFSVWELDMLSYASIQAFAQRCNTLPKLDIAILNAGIGGSSTSKINESTGHEETIQVNYLSTAFLSILLLPILAPSLKDPFAAPGRLTIVGSGTAPFASFPQISADPLLPSFDIPFTGFTAAGERYATSKLLIMMLVHTLSTRIPSTRVIINTVEPGLTADTNLHGNFSGSGALVMRVMKKLSARTPEQAAWTYVDACGVKGEESHGGFVMFWEVCGFPKVMYTDEGRKCTERLWDETMAELQFADVQEVL